MRTGPLSAINQPFDVCLCLGDLVDYGPGPCAVRPLGDDARHLCDPRQPRPRSRPGDPGQRRRTGFRYLTQAPPAVDVGGARARGARDLLATAGDAASHSWRAGDTCWFTPPRATRSTSTCSRTPRSWAKRLQNVEADVVCVGHTHIQFNIQVNGVMVLNPGSVGLPRDGDPRAAYAVIDDNKIELNARLSRRRDDRPDRGDALAAPGQGDHGQRAAPRPPAGRDGSGRTDFRAR